MHLLTDGVMREIVRTSVLTVTTICAPYMRSMEARTLSAITQWPHHVFNNAYQGSNYIFTTKGLAKHIKKSYTMAKPEKTKYRIIYDWLYTLDNVQKKFLKKPFQDWALGDIISIAPWLQRFSEGTPGSFRDTRACTRLRSLTKDEWKEFVPKFLKLKKTYGDDLIDKHMFLYLADEYPAGVIFHHTDPDSIKEGLKNAVLKAQEACAQLNVIQDLFERQHACTALAAELHYDIFRIRPFRSANKRLGRILMNVIRMQYGFKPLAFTDQNTYAATLVQCLRDGSPKKFQEYCMAATKDVNKGTILEDSEKGRALLHKHLKDIEALVEIRKNGTKGIRNGYTQKNDTKNLNGSTAIKKCAACGKQNSANLTLRRCGTCKKTYYCNLTCQLYNWQAHTLICTNQKETP